MQPTPNHPLVPPRLAWADVVRLAAILMVIAVHCADPFNVSPEARANPEFNFWGSIYGSFLRPCVPLFVMLTGMFLLPIRESMSAFYRKRLLRIVVPFLVWSVFYNLVPWLTGVLGLGPEVVSRLFAYAGPHPSQAWADSWHHILLIPFQFSTYTVPMWYMYMLIGLYLYMPVFSAWVAQATARQQQLFLAVWGITLFLPYAYEFASRYLLGVCAWNSFGVFYYFAGFNGYLLLGHYLRRHNRLNLLRSVLLSVVLFGIGYALTYLGFRHMTARLGISEEQLELFFLYCSPNVALMTLAVFISAQQIRLSSPAVTRALANITKCGLGIYLTHYLLVGIGYSVVDALRVPVAIRIPVTAGLVFLAAWALVALSYRVYPRLAKWVLG
ncbi:acyltransferase [Hymenobacter sp. 15J16-1T3B]|uniref:acyltransferase n=1 Tax=Hymenobacter sp. 15J16-1T3B TaxID=2886941 RepID=UPI001D119E33|nr:acyltransferase [Hymenobacter sp. 15J16-1T3B]MCC3158025.1 acyltransferase [Hymenobacter sp. 15J16-1T3B]